MATEDSTHVPPDKAAIQLRIFAGMDRATVEALQLEIRQLAAKHGLEVESVQITPDHGEPSSAPDATLDSAEGP